MYALFEDSGKLGTGRILSQAQSSSQIELESGKRIKVKDPAILFKFETPKPEELLTSAKEICDSIDLQIAWEFAPTEEFSFLDLSVEYFSASPSSAEQVAMLKTLHDAPHYFRRMGKGRFKKASAEVIQQALIAIERKKELLSQIGAWADELALGKCPQPVSDEIYKILFKPDKNSAAYKAVVQAAKQAQMPAMALLTKAGAIASAYEFHWQRFLFDQFPKGFEFQSNTAAPTAAELDKITAPLPLASAVAFSIDDSQTTEIDDAFSVVGLPDGNWRIGIHIALPALGIAPGSEIDAFARGRMSTVYMPGDKFTMLPDSVVEHFTLAERRWCPALSLYLTVNGEDCTILSEETCAEQVFIAANLRHGNIEAALSEENLLAGVVEGIPFAKELTFLWRLANSRALARGHIERSPPSLDYNFYVENHRVEIVPRVRGNPIDRIVSEMMIHVNQSWGGLIKEKGMSGIYRSQVNGKTGLGVEALPHQGLGVNQYAWSSSPLRRYVDLINQWQLLAHVQGRDPVWPADGGELTGVARSFETAYDSYNEFQRTMERFWSLRWLIQNEVKQTTVTMLREGSGRVRGTPLIVKVHGASELAPGTLANVDLGHPDLWELTVTCHYRALA